jgi:Ca2+-binding RTX toxin-like protein
MSGSFNGSDATAEAIRAQVLAAISAENALATAGSLAYTQGATFPPVPAGSAGAVNFQSAVVGTVQIPATYQLVYDLQPSPLVLIGGGEAGQVATASQGGLTYDFNGGSGVAYTTLKQTSGNTFFLDGPGSYVALGSGADTVAASTGNNIIATGTGTNAVFLGSGNNYVASEGTDTIVSGTGNDTIEVTGNALIYGNAGPLIFANNGTGTPTVVAGSGTTTIYGNTGGGVYEAGTAGNSLLVAGVGATTLFGAANGDALYARGSASDVLVAGAGIETLTGGGATGNNQYFAGPGGDLIGAGAGQDTIIAGTGNDTMYAGTGPDAFDFINGQAGGADYIGNFNIGTDAVNLFGYDAGDGSAAAAAFAGRVFDNGNTIVTLPDRTTITFIGVTNLTPASLIG